MRLVLPHKLSKDEVRRRLHEHAGELAGGVPGGMAELKTDWVSDDLVNLTVSAMGQNLKGNIAIEDGEVVIEMDLPLALSFVEPMISGTIREHGQKLLN